MNLHSIFQVLKHPLLAWDIKQAKNEHRKKHPDCECCKTKPSFWGRANDVHHKVPVHIAPEKACDPDNLITLCRHCHWLFGHLRDWTDWNVNLIQTISGIQLSFKHLVFSGKHKSEGMPDS